MPRRCARAIEQSVLLFGVGGQQVELIRDRTLGLPPLNTTLARRMMEQTRIFQFLQGIRRAHPPVDLARWSGCWSGSVGWWSNSLSQRDRHQAALTSPGQLIALDASLILHGAEVDADQLPRPAIRPYPTQCVVPWTAPNGLAVTNRPIR